MQSVGLGDVAAKMDADSDVVCVDVAAHRRKCRQTVPPFVFMVTPEGTLDAGKRVRRCRQPSCQV